MIALAVFLGLLGCDRAGKLEGPPDGVRRIYLGSDEQVWVFVDNGVRCYVYDGFKAGGVSCLPETAK
jgi:hypothetical protein